jgi:putative ABC transport system substrate-binding protein
MRRISGCFAAGRRLLFITATVMLPMNVLGAAAQSPTRMVTLGILSGFPDRAADPIQGLEHGLRDLGYVEGKNLKVEWRSSQGDVKRLPPLAAELVSLRPDVIFATDTPTSQAVHSATTTIPVVFAGIADPIGSGLIASLASPHGNLTGRGSTSPDLEAKRLQLIAETMPGLCCVLALENLKNPVNVATAPTLREAAMALRLELKSIDASTASELKQAFATIDERFRAVLIRPDAEFILLRSEIAEIARQRHLAVVGFRAEDARVGGLFAYGIDAYREFRAAASYIDRIVKGAKPGDLPVEQPTEFKLVANLKTANALGITIPLPILVRADEVIE